MGTFVHTHLLAGDYSGPSSVAVLRVMSRDPGNLKEPFRVHEVKTIFLAILSYLPFSLSCCHESTMGFFQRPKDMGYCNRPNAEADVRSQASSVQTLDL